MIKLLSQSKYKAHKSAEKFIHRRQHKKTRRRRRRKEEEKKKRRRRRWGSRLEALRLHSVFVHLQSSFSSSCLVKLRVGHFVRRTRSARDSAYSFVESTSFLPRKPSVELLLSKSIEEVAWLRFFYRLHWKTVGKACIALYCNRNRICRRGKSAPEDFGSF